MVYRTNLLYHVKVVNECLPRFRLEAQLNLQDLRLTVRGRNRYYLLAPQFLKPTPAGVSYSPFFDNDVVGFIGWLPYFNKRWPTGSDKFAFKAFCEAQGLRTPQYSRRSGDAVRDVLIKRTNSSFGMGFRGPFASIDAGTSTHQISQHEYYERFIEGRIAKAWYWEDRLACMELRDMPAVSGDGRATLYELVQRATVPPQQPPARSEVEGLARYQGFLLDDVVPAGKRLIADFRYSSGLIPLNRVNQNALDKHKDTRIGRQLAEAGRTLFAGIPADVRTGTLYSVDAIVDASDDVWFLEMNCNPAVHPDCYHSMLEGLFGAPEKIVAPANALGLSFGAPAPFPHDISSGNPGPRGVFPQGPLMPGDVPPPPGPGMLPPPMPPSGHFAVGASPAPGRAEPPAGSRGH